MSITTYTPIVISIIPTLFYANNSTLLASSFSNIQRLIDITTAQYSSNKMELNIKKCSYLTSSSSTSLILPTVSSSPLPYIDKYTYLSFPITSKSIDFQRYLTSRIEEATARASFLSIFSNSQGLAYCLRIYYTYLAPIFEYGSPLVAAYVETDPAFYNSTITELFSTLIGWIVGSKASPNLTANLLSLEPLKSRFRALKVMF